MASQRERTADRRAWYAWQVAERLHQAGIRAAAWPHPTVDWSCRVYVGYAEYPGAGVPAVRVEFTPHDELDAGGVWLADIHLPDCCVLPAQSRIMQITLDEPGLDGSIDKRPDQQGAYLATVATRAGQAWADHRSHTYTARQVHPTAPTNLVMVL